jgi:hypothetical protein
MKDLRELFEVILLYRFILEGELTKDSEGTKIDVGFNDEMTTTKQSTYLFWIDADAVVLNHKMKVRVIPISLLVKS